MGTKGKHLHFACKSCGFDAETNAHKLGEHYKLNPAHKPRYQAKKKSWGHIGSKKITKSVKPLTPSSDDVTLMLLIENPDVAFSHIQDAIAREERMVEELEDQVAMHKRRIDRLNRLTTVIEGTVPRMPHNDEVV